MTDDNITDFRARRALGKTPSGPANDYRPPREPAINLPPVVKRLSLFLFLVMCVQQVMPLAMENDFILTFGFVPARYSQGFFTDWTAWAAIPAHMFIHGGWMHLLMNVGMLMAFGTALEKSAGGRALMILFVVTGFIGTLFHFALYPHLEAPMVGASGGISGLFGAVLVIMKNQGQLGIGRQRLWPFVIVWIAISLFFGFTGVPGSDSPVAWTVHVAGFIAGLLLFNPVVVKLSKIH